MRYIYLIRDHHAGNKMLELSSIIDVKLKCNYILHLNALNIIDDIMVKGCHIAILKLIAISRNH